MGQHKTNLTAIKAANGKFHLSHPQWEKQNTTGGSKRRFMQLYPRLLPSMSNNKLKWQKQRGVINDKIPL